MKKFMLLILALQLFATAGFSRKPYVPAEIESIDIKLAEDEMAVTFFDLKSGEATLIQHGNGENILINTGGPGTSRQLKSLIAKYKVDKLKSVIVTKDDPEYTANLKWLAENFKVDEFVVGSTASELAQQITAYGANNVQKWMKGNVLQKMPGLELAVLHEEYVNPGTEGLDLSLKFGKLKMLYMSTNDPAIEKKLVQEKLSKINVLKVAEFANSGTSQAFLEYVDPQIAVIFRKKGVPPGQDVFERLQETWIDIYQTKQFGNITIKCTPDRYEVITISLQSAYAAKLTSSLTARA